MFVKVVDGGCPICKGEVRGNSRNKYYCQNCNLLFRAFQLDSKGKLKEVISDNPKVKKRLKLE